MENEVNQPASYTDFSQFGMYEYMLVINPEEAVKNKIMEEKESFSQKYQYKMASKTQPHITVANFLSKEAIEETLCRWIQRICSQLESFPLLLNNYSGFPSHTIYLRIQDAAPFRLLATHLKIFDQLLQSSSCPPLKLIYTPHLTIARRLASQIYSRAMMEYSQKIFHESFMAEGIVLLRRAHQFDKCKTINVFRFLPSGNSVDKVA